jgi:hypothetical protein
VRLGQTISRSLNAFSGNVCEPEVLERFRLTRETLDWVLGEVESKFNQSLVHPGELYGALSVHIMLVSRARTSLLVSHVSNYQYCDKYQDARLVVYLGPEFGLSSALAKTSNRSLRTHRRKAQGDGS